MPIRDGFIVKAQQELQQQYDTCKGSRAPYGRATPGSLRSGDPTPCDFCTDTCDNDFALPSGCTLVS